MASILRVNTLTDASSNNSTAMSTINQGTAKAWADFTGVTTTALRDSFNVSGLTDNATGSTSVALSSNMSTLITLEAGMPMFQQALIVVILITLGQVVLEVEPQQAMVSGLTGLLLLHLLIAHIMIQLYLET